MLSTRQLDEGQRHPRQTSTNDRTEQPYAIIWMHGKEIKLFEDARGNYFTA